VKVGGILSWEYVLNHKRKRTDLNSRYPDLIAVEMEGGSMGYIAQNLRKDFRNLEFLSVRGISDLCAEKEDDVWRDVAADTAAAVLIGYLFHKAWLPVFEETSE
jgi:nucleoside phosphorylase